MPNWEIVMVIVTILSLSLIFGIYFMRRIDRLTRDISDLREQVNEHERRFRRMSEA